MPLGATSQAAPLTRASQPAAAPTAPALAGAREPGGTTMPHGPRAQHRTPLHPRSLHLMPQVPYLMPRSPFNTPVSPSAITCHHAP